MHTLYHNEGLVFGDPDGTVVGGLVFSRLCDSLVFGSLESCNLKWVGTFVGSEFGTCL